VMARAQQAQRAVPLPVALAQQASNPVALHGRSCLSNSKSHRTLVRWDFPLYIIVTSNISALDVPSTGKHASECPISAKDFRF
jgi:hypothetical protein